MAILQFYLTDVGRNAGIDAENLDLHVSLSHIAVGSAKYNGATAANTKTALTNELARYPLNGGGVDATSHTLRFVVNIEATITADIFEVGLYTNTGVLFAVAAVTGNSPLIQLVTNIVTIVTIGLTFVDVDFSNIQIMIDPNTPVAIALMNQHLAHQNPHPQYAKKLDFDNHVAQNAFEHNNLTALIAAEAQARANADAAEAQARGNADNALEDDIYALSVSTENALEQERQIRATAIQNEINERAAAVWEAIRQQSVFIAKYLNNTEPYLTSEGSASGTFNHNVIGYELSLGSCLNNPYINVVNPSPNYNVGGITFGNNNNKTGFMLKLSGFIQFGCFAEQGDTSWSGLSVALSFYDEHNNLLAEVPLNLAQVAGGWPNNSNVGHTTYRFDNGYDLYSLFKPNGFTPNDLRLALRVAVSVNSDGGSPARSILTVEKFAVRCVQ
ncbi:phage tail-collar fiber domain-containing protein [Alkanindiges illinoisensis]|uniref:phage tail-collar fiber domain-containing protein n=1 Tax=Alkanindiges illinoisensis TaxID=197183 RepID=UPI00047DC3B6|nr:phage tail protein [Alkanindiges illinoisensis]